MTKGESVHVQAADDVAMAGKSTLGVLAHPVPPTDLLAVLAVRTPARGPPFGAGEAQDASLRTLLREVVFVLAVFPLAHALMVMPPAWLVAYAMRVPDEDRLDPFVLQEADDLPGRFVPPVADLPLGACPQPGLSTLQGARAARAFGATRLLALQLTQALIVAALEAADASPAHDESLASGRGYRRQVNFAQIDGSLRHP